MKKVLITGSNGQLGQSLRRLSEANSSLDFIFTDRSELDITDRDSVLSFFREHLPDYCINCAAYTQVDLAEKEVEKCFQINVSGVENLVAACSEGNCVLIHISTDFVFDGRKRSPYGTEDQPNPINVYGLSKYKAEQVIEKTLEKYFIVRTSWVYSEYGKNFVKTMLRLGEERNEIQVVNDQVGVPTYAGDLADFLILLCKYETWAYGTYHFSSSGQTSWFGFALEIYRLAGVQCKILPLSSEFYASPARRPRYSVLSDARIPSTMVKPWEESLAFCINKIKEPPVVKKKKK